MIDENAKKNRLAKEKSPYLLQHATNPVDWYPWGEEAFAKAKQTNKPILLSIGYSTCHWCHVMAHESFEDPEVARLMNETFVNIKVDREERPDIDNIYMTVCQMLTGSGGWPLTIFLTPERAPFFAATYIPKEPRFGRYGMMQLIPRIQETWNQKGEDLIRSAAEITQALKQTSTAASGDLLGLRALEGAALHLENRFDRTFGGFGDSPKFPTPHNAMLLLRHQKRTQSSRPLEMVEKTLKSMRLGGIYDHLGYGFHRYSTDREWLVPHFEKMLYDQALLTMAYIETYQVTGNEEYADIAREIITYVLRDMTSPEGGFYSAEDADSEGEEGKFYVWTLDEIREVLGKEEADEFCEVFNVSPNGNFVDPVAEGPTHHNILHLRKPLADIAAAKKVGVSELKARIEQSRAKLFEHREKRIHPHKDDKILADWNGLMIAALSKAARVLQDKRYESAARKAIDFVFKNMTKSEDELLHRYREGEAGLPAHVDDYAFLIWGLLEFYETTFEADLLKRAISFMRYQLQHFWDGTGGAFYFTSDQSEELILRTKEIYDGAVPSGNSVSMLNLLRLARITGDVELETKAQSIERAFAGNVAQIPSAHTQLMAAIDFRVGPSYEVVVVGDRSAADTQQMLREINSRFLPNKVLLLRDPQNPDIDRIAPYAEVQKQVNEKATAYVCRNFVCNKPTTEINEVLDLLK